jgi:hypothetical protein
MQVSAGGLAHEGRNTSEGFQMGAIGWVGVIGIHKSSLESIST